MRIEGKKAARVSFTQVSKRFAETGTVIDDFSLDIKPGDFVTLLGPSGCGKSTLLRMAAGLDSANSGKTTIDSFGREHFRGFVFQEPYLMPWRTTLENTVLPLELMKINRLEARKTALDALARVGLQDAAALYPAALSGGMKMRASVARALVSQPSLLLLDEPFAALDENTRFRLQEDLRSLWEREGMTVIFVTHSVAEAVFLSNRIIVLSTRPARIVRDHSVALPTSRSGSLRTESEFLDETKILRSALLGSEVGGQR